MKILITEQQLNILLEETNGLDSLLSDIVYTYPETKDHIEVIKTFIINSGCQNISVEKLKMGVQGLALHDRVVLNTSVFNDRLSLPKFLFVLFHEIAHQYQYKKYGMDKMYEVYIGELSLEDGAKWMKNVEIIADEFATRKIRQFVNLGLIDKKQEIPKGFYRVTPESMFIKLISNVRNKIKENNITNKKDVSELFYNIVKNNLQ
jgi:hypothetical protein